ncbi:DUF2637 domain-containing protein [Kitasatospora sp. NPDC059646]|uniref:DUF2637 domain-containing protein n=1 Tax=Kitasatospora sp. NPDC059646 TaxID=3346893 RepID=UPI00367DE474
MTLTAPPPTAARTLPAPPAPGPVSLPTDAVSATPSGISDAPWAVSETPAERPKRNVLMGALSVLAAAGSTLVGAIGFRMSYDTLRQVAQDHWGFSQDLAQWFPVGVDASIVAFLALDLYMIRKKTPWSALRLAAHVMTVATIWFNAAAQGSLWDDPVRAASHGVMPGLFVMGVEAARRLVIRKAQLEDGTSADGVPLHRWLLSPVKSARMYRRMRLYDVRSYPEMVRRDQELIAYELWLKRKHGGDLSKASDEELLPMKMAPYGYTVAKALAMPADQDRAAEERAEEAERRRLEAETRRKKAEARAQAEALRADGEVQKVKAEIEGETGQARAHAKAQVTAAERAAAAEEEALETALVAEARARTAAAERQEAEEREERAAADLRAAELERLAAEERRQAAEADRAAVAEAQAVETATIAAARQTAAEADRAAAEAEAAAAETRRAAAETERLQAEEIARREAAIAEAQQSALAAAEAEMAAAETRRAAAEIERAAVEAEDVAKLKPRERAVRKVARMILTAHAANPDSASAEQVVPLAEIQAALDVSSPATASEYRQEAIELLAQGYRP